MHVNSVQLTLSQRATVLIQTRLRTRQAYQEFFQARIGPVLNFDAGRRVTLIGGYNFNAQHYPALKTSQWVDHNRYFGGASVRLVNRGAWKVDWRNLIERFQDTPGGDYTRFRSRGGAGRTRRDWTATATMEGLYAQSRATVRLGAGTGGGRSGDGLRAACEFCPDHADSSRDLRPSDAARGHGAPDSRHLEHVRWQCNERAIRGIPDVEQCEWAGRHCVVPWRQPRRRNMAGNRGP